MTADSLLQDVRHGLRLMRRSPAFALTAALVLSLGIGVNTALFSIVNVLFFRDRQVPAADQVFFMYEENLSRQRHQLNDAGGRPHPLLNSELAEYSATVVTSVRMTVDDETLRVPGELVAWNYFDVLDVRVSAGRSFRQEDADAASTDYCIVVSDDFWARRLGREPNAIGRQVRINDRFYRVIGVAAPEFNGLGNPLRPSAFWALRSQTMPLGAMSARIRQGVFGRLAPAVTLEQIRAFIAARAPSYRDQVFQGLRPETRERFRDWVRFAQFPIVPLNDLTYISDPDARAISPKLLGALVTVVLLVLLIASANIAGLLLARGVTRTSEVAVRRALGASGPRLARQLLTESVLLALSGGTIGFFVAWMLVALFRSFTPSTLVVDTSVDLRVLAFAAVLCVGAGVGVGLAPAAQAARVNVLEALGAGIAGARRVRTRLRHGIVVPQVALSLVLLVVAAIHVRSLLDVELTDLGYRTDSAIVLDIGRWEPRVQNQSRTRAEQRQIDEEEAVKVRTFNRNLLARLENSSSVSFFGVASGLPLQMFRSDLPPVITPDGGPSRVNAGRTIVSDGYFDAMGMRLMSGRTFDGRDAYGAKPAAIISDTVARKLWPNGVALGQTVAFQPATSEQKIEWLEVIGVVNEVDPVIDDVGERPMIYVSVLQQWRGGVYYAVVQGTGDQAQLIKEAKTAILGADPFAEVTQVRTMRQIVGEILYPRRVAAAILTTAGLIGLVLACIGLYGVMSYSIGQRRREIGIRATLGADRRDIVRLVLREGAAVTLLGTAIGGALTFIALRLSANVVAGVPMLDVVSFVTVPLVLMLIVVAACLVPAFKAANTDPANVLRA